MLSKKSWVKSKLLHQAITLAQQVTLVAQVVTTDEAEAEADLLAVIAEDLVTSTIKRPGVSPPAALIIKP